MVPAGAALAVGFASAAVADPVAYGRHLSGECTTCHRLDGEDKGIPSITGWKIEDFVNTLGFYKSGERKNPAMNSVAQSLDDEQIAALAAFFATLPKPLKRPLAAGN